jgi:uncharacterized protein
LSAAEREVRPEGVAETALKRVEVEGTLSAIDTDLIFRGRVAGDFEEACDRCLEPAKVRVEQEVTWLFSPGAAPEPVRKADEDEDEDEFDAPLDSERVRYFDGEEVDLAPEVWEEMMLAAPAKYYCRDDCKGLCPSCGKNWNTGACKCAQQEEVNHSGLAALKDLFPNLPSQAAEE